MKIKPVTLCAHGGYEASFEACFVDLGCLEKHNFSTVLLENSRKHHSIAVNSHKALLFGPVSRLAVVAHCSVDCDSFKVVIFAATTKLVVATSN